MSQSRDQKLSLQRYAEALAHVAYFEAADQGELRRRLGITEEAWQQACAHWPPQLQRDLAAGRNGSSQELSKSFAETKARLEAERPALTDIGAPEDAEDEAAEDASESVPPQQPEQLPKQGARPYPPLQPAPASGSSPWAPSTPPAIPESERTAQGATPTPGPAVPFREDPNKAPPAPAAEEITQVPAGQTAEVPALADDDGAAIDQTAFVPALDIENPLPFDEEAEPSIPSAAALDEDPANVGATQAVPAILADEDSVLPFETSCHDDSAEALRARLTLEQYASLESELAVRPARRELILRRYGLTDETALGRLQDAWRNHLEHHPEQEARFQGLLTQYRQWLASQKR